MVNKNYPDMYNVCWETQSKNSSESMPVGGGDIGLNVWVEEGDLLFYIARSNTFDECNHLLKLGRVRMKWDPNPLLGEEDFLQELKLAKGCIEITAEHKEYGEIWIRIWVEIDRPVIHVETNSSKSLDLDVAFESWRTRDRELPLDEKQTRFHAFGYNGYPDRVILQKDSIDFKDQGVEWFHQNQGETIFDKEVKEQELEEIKNELWNPLSKRIFGGFLEGDNLKCGKVTEGRYVSNLFKAWHLESEKSATSHHLRIYLNTEKTNSLKTWRQKIKELRKEESDTESLWEKHQKWWSDFWQRSWIVINPESEEKNEPWEVAKNYQLFRFMLGCTGLGEYPIKFNGGFFTFDPQFHETDWDWLKKSGESPDYRAWGGGSYTAQNQRLVYWPLLKTGDFDLIKPQLNFYRRGLKNAILRTHHYWGHEGCCFTEQMNQYALPIGATYGWEDSYVDFRDRTQKAIKGEQVSSAVGKLYESQLEFSWMALLYFSFSGEDIKPYLDFVEQSVLFYDEHYRYRHQMRTGNSYDENDHLVIWPANTLENHLNAKNPTSVISGLKSILTSLLNMQESYQPEEKKGRWRTILDHLPPLPKGEKDGKEYLKPAENWEHNSNHSPEMYPLFPYSFNDTIEVSKEIMQNTWEIGLDEESRNSVKAWVQGGIHAAHLGLTNHVKNWIIRKLSDSAPNARFRFPAFWDSFDYPPDHNHGGTGMIALQEMLMQSNGDEIYLLPAWPKDWNVDFRLHAPQQTIIEASVRHGEMVELKVKPNSRREDIVLKV